MRALILSNRSLIPASSGICPSVTGSRGVTVLSRLATQWRKRQAWASHIPTKKSFLATPPSAGSVGNQARRTCTGATLEPKHPQDRSATRAPQGRGRIAVFGPSLGSPTVFSTSDSTRPLRTIRARFSNSSL
jgi:hypothetical protein